MPSDIENQGGDGPIEAQVKWYNARKGFGFVLGPDGQLIPEMTVAEVQAGIEAGWISGGMIPKVETCVNAVRGGVKGAVILDGRVPHAVLRELFTNRGAGTLIRA